MELFFLALLVVIMAVALGSGYPVAFALPGAAIITIGLAAAAGYMFGEGTDAYFHSGGPQQWLSAGVTNLRGVYWERCLSSWALCFSAQRSLRICC